MSRDEMLKALQDALDSLRRISPAKTGKGQHHCALCDASGKHPCPMFEAIGHIYEAHTIAYSLPETRGEG